MAREFVRRWCPKEFEAAKARIAKRNAGTTVEVFAWRWFAEVVQKNVRKPKNIKRALEKDIIPRIGSMQLRDITPTDIFSIVDPIKNRGAEQMALQTRGMLKRMFDYAVVRELATTNPAGAIKAKFIATASSRSTVLTPTEIGAAFRKIYQSNMKRANKLALHLIMITLVRKSMLLEARWGDVNFTDSEWEIPAERMKLNHAHVVPLSQQALEILGELKFLSNGSEWIMPSVRNSKKHVSNGILNSAVKGLVFNTQAFVIHDFRRTASTLLNEQGYNKDWIEKALSHETLGIRGVYNKAEYLVPRRKLMRSWAAFVDTQIADDRRVVIGGFKQSQNVA
jgi:integrase